MKSFGTEDRRQDGTFLPPSGEIYEYIIFKGALTSKVQGRFKNSLIVYQGCAFMVQILKEQMLSAGADIKDLAVLQNEPTEDATASQAPEVRVQSL